MEFASVNLLSLEVGYMHYGLNKPCSGIVWLHQIRRLLDTHCLARRLKQIVSEYYTLHR